MQLPLFKICSDILRSTELESRPEQSQTARERAAAQIRIQLKMAWSTSVCIFFNYPDPSVHRSPRFAAVREKKEEQIFINWTQLRD